MCLNPLVKSLNVSIVKLLCSCGVFLFSINIWSDGGGKVEGGVSDGGGGSAVACFWQAADARSALDNKGRLNPEARRKVVSLSVTDLFEFSGPILLPEVEQEELTPTDYLNFIVETKISPLAPTFAKNLKFAIEKTSFAKWKRNQDIHLINDVLSTSSLVERKVGTANCELVPLVNRKQNLESHSPEVSIEYDDDLFAKLFRNNHNQWPSQSVGDNFQYGKMNQVALLLHEALYFMGTYLGHKDSVKVRRLTSLLLSYSLYHYAKNTNDFHMALNSTGFDLQYLLFVPLDKVHENSIKSQRNLAYQNVMNYLFSLDRKLMDENTQFTQQFSSFSLESRFHLFLANRFHILSDQEALKKLTDVEAFMMQAWLLKDDLINLESLLNPYLDDEGSIVYVCEYSRSRYSFDEILRKSKGRVYKDLSVSTGYEGEALLHKKVLSYCQSLGKN